VQENRTAVSAADRDQVRREREHHGPGDDAEVDPEDHPCAPQPSLPADQVEIRDQRGGMDDVRPMAIVPTSRGIQVATRADFI
jgi:hypothetical protein